VKQTYTVTEAAELIGCSENTVYPPCVKMGVVLKGTDYLFSIVGDKPFKPGTVSQYWTRLMKRAGYAVTFHGGRHSHISLLLNDGYGIKDVQERAGHSTSKTTSDIYGHLSLSRRSEIADRFDEIMGTDENGQTIMEEVEKRSISGNISGR